MRDKNRIPRILSLIGVLWDRYPDLRFGQLLEVYLLKEMNNNNNTFSYEDEKLEELLVEIYDKEKRTES